MKSPDSIRIGLAYCGIEPVNDDFCDCDNCPYYSEPKECSTVLLNDALERIVQLESQLAAAQKKGHWLSETDHVTGDTGYSCSECDRAYWFNDGNPIDNHYHFCPNCGATLSMTLFGGD